MPLPEINYQHFSLNRASDLRKNFDWLTGQRSNQYARFMLINQGDYLFENNDVLTFTLRDASPALNNHSIEDLLAHVEAPLFLGLEDDAPLFTVDCSSLNDNILNHFITANTKDALSTQGNLGIRWKLFRSAIAHVNSESLATLGYGRAIAHWNLHHQFCGFCGGETKMLDGGHRRKCTRDKCQKEHFPRTDPAVIMLIEHQDENGIKRCLLAQHQRHEHKVVSTLAGFVDPGETLEQTVIREAYEEAGVIINEVNYVATQPWPFPSSLMVGFIAKAQSCKITLDTEELVSAQWFTADEVRSFDDWGDESENYKLPRKGSIARYLVERWLQTQL